MELCSDPQKAGSFITKIGRNGFEAEIDCHEMGAGGSASLTQKRRGQQPPKLGHMLQDGELAPGIGGHDHPPTVGRSRSTPRHSSSLGSSSQSRS